ncbi:MAG TPA: prepilin peptidase [Bryobacteraceae bacterium]|jgi:prepilin peptidase CpaA|nr:prepilin peptidase [Bryobacteraceae bacterium]
MHSIAWWPTLAVVVAATVADIRARRIPNWLVIPFLLAGLAGSGITGGWLGFGQSVLGMLLGGVSTGVLYWLGGLGMGDVKLCAAIGAWIGPHQLVTALVLTGIAGGVIAIAEAIRGGFLKQSLSGTTSLLCGFARRGLRPDPRFVLSHPAAKRIPYAPAIAIGTIISFFALP